MTDQETSVDTLHFSSSAKFRKWLEKNHEKSDGFWMRICKKAAVEKSVTYAEALDEALCFGWIDGQKKPLDGSSWLQKFTPRRVRSGWSKRNTEHVARLTEAGLIRPAGLKQIETAKADGRWAAAYSGPKDARVPEDFLAALNRNKKAKAFFDSLNKANLYAIVYQLHTAKKPETRERRFNKLLAMLARGEAVHSFKSKTTRQEASE